jgi:hypothetical protein
VRRCHGDARLCCKTPLGSRVFMIQPFRQLELLSRSLANSDHSSGVLVRKNIGYLTEQIELDSFPSIDHEA